MPADRFEGDTRVDGAGESWTDALPATSWLEYAFLHWVLQPAARSGIRAFLTAQRVVETAGHAYRLDYAIETDTIRVAVELDGFAYHGDRAAFTYDRLRQNDLQAAGWAVVRFSYDAIRAETSRCVTQLQSVLRADAALAPLLVSDPVVTIPELPDTPLQPFTRAIADQRRTVNMHAPPFETIRASLNLKTLRGCQADAFAALGNYYRAGGTRAACIMSVGAGKTALGVLACLAFAHTRALVVTPGTVIRGTFDRAFDHQAVGNVLYGLPGGPLIPGCRPPRVRTLDRDTGPIRSISREQLLSADIIVTNFHSLGTGDDSDDLLAKLAPDDIDFVVVDEAHIAAAESYQRLFRRFVDARTLLMSACFQRLDGKPIDADVVYRYRLVDSIADGNAKNLRVQRFAPDANETIYEMVWPDGTREEIVGREALLDILGDERKLARITARSDASIRRVVRAAREALDRQAELLDPVKPRVLFSALGERHAEQVARIAEEHGIPCGTLHHTMPEARIRATRERFEQDSGDLQGIVQLKMLGQGYDFPPVTVVVPVRPYGSFSEFYQFVGRGIRVLQHPALAGRVGPERQVLDIIYHAELGLDEHIETIYRENDMDPRSVHSVPGMAGDSSGENSDEILLPGSRGPDIAQRPDTFVLFEHGEIERRIVHDRERVERRREEREREALAQRYAAYAATTPTPVTFEQFAQLMQVLRG